MHREPLNKVGAGKVAQWVKVLATKHDYSSLISGAHMVEREK